MAIDRDIQAALEKEALEFAYLLYDIFQEEQANGNVSNDNPDQVNICQEKY